ncbi:MAG: riboflavin synthase [Actinomycetota bacterium]|nr:riboflavin synthase [Actinomycetota bacterium]
MFTGIVQDTGVVVAVEDLTDEARRLRIRSAVVATGARPGESICVAGVCLTVVEPDGPEFGADVMKETLERSSLGLLGVGDRVNLETAMAVGDRFGGHIVSGHVDGRAELLERTDSEHWRVLRFALPVQLRRFVAEKGSITLDGVSLTVAEAGADWFTVSLIPTTLAETTLGAMVPGDLVNVEIDMLARYVQRLLEHQ